jgi:hypothetical protein
MACREDAVPLHRARLEDGELLERQGETGTVAGGRSHLVN